MSPGAKAIIEYRMCANQQAAELVTSEISKEVWEEAVVKDEVVGVEKEATMNSARVSHEDCRTQPRCWDSHNGVMEGGVCPTSDTRGASGSANEDPVQRCNCCEASNSQEGATTPAIGEVPEQSRQDAAQGAGAQRTKEVDWQAYLELRSYYLELVVVQGDELAMDGGRQIRRTRLESDEPGFPEMRRKIAALEKVGDHAEIFALLHQLKQWEMHHPGLACALPAALPAAGGSENMPIDLTTD